MLAHLLTNYGYPAIIIGTFLEGETVLVLAGLAAQAGYLSLDWVIVCGFAGTVLGDQIYFSLGRYHGKSWLKRKKSWQARAERVFDILERHQNLFIIGFRFMYGIRTVTPFAIGMSNVSYLRFILLNVSGAAIWAASIALAGYYFGHVVETVIGDIKHYELALMLSIIAISSLVWIVYYVRNKREPD
jgi:membrane protein DedA with SNARE-associated domain